MATTWVDGTTPVNATNLNALESSVTSVTEKVDGMTDMTNKYKGSTNTGSTYNAGTYQVRWGTSSTSIGRIAAIITCYSYQSGGRGIILFAGDMYARQTVVDLSVGSKFSYETLSDGVGVELSLYPDGTSSWIINILMLAGNLPTIEQIS